MRNIRSKVGCFTCRRRKKKCNEQKPVCSGCRRNRLSCNWPASPSGQSVPHGRALPSDYVQLEAPAHDAIVVVAVTAESHDTQRTDRRPRRDLLRQGPQQEQLHRQQDQQIDLAVDRLPSGRSRALTRVPSDSNVDIVIDAPHADAVVSSASPSVVSHLSSSQVSSPCSPKENDAARAVESGGESSGESREYSSSNAGGDVTEVKDGVGDLAWASIGAASPNIPFGIPLIPHHSAQSSGLLSYYLARTANSMGNGSTDTNPFIVKLVPMAFSNSFILQLILAQSAAHREEALEDWSARAVAQQYYTKSLRLFSDVVGAYVSGSRIDVLVLSFGSLIMSLTEIARGEIHGTIFNHLSAAESLVSTAISNAQQDIQDDLFDFLIEYYVHMTATSMLSIDVQYGSQLFLTPSIRPAAQALVAKQYVGQLCGVWLELLLLIPQIFQLGQRMLGNVASGQKLPPPDAIITFGCIQSQVLAYSPTSSASTYANVAGLVFKQAVLLYLWTMLGNPLSNDTDDSFSVLIRGAVKEAVLLLDQLPATERVNTSLCWPLTIIGCCTADSAIRSQLRERLQTMSRTIGLGNMKQTLALLESVWEEDPENISPWALCKSMQKYQLWISLA